MLLTHCQDHILTENIWFVWSRTSYSGDKWRCHRCGTDGRTNDERRTREDRATQPMDCWRLSLAKIRTKWVWSSWGPSPQLRTFLHTLIRKRKGKGRSKGTYWSTGHYTGHNHFWNLQHCFGVGTQTWWRYLTGIQSFSARCHSHIHVTKYATTQYQIPI